MDRQLFVLGQDIWDSIDIEIVNQTTEALIELNLFIPPYREFDIRATSSTKNIEKFYKYEVKDEIDYKDERSETFRYVISGDKFFYQYKKANKFYTAREIYEDAISVGMTEENAEQVVGYATQAASTYLNTLIVLLSTKNAEKQTEEIKRHGPKSRKRPKEYRYITTIKIGKITETMQSSGIRGSVRAHLRRGHIRNQRIGEGRKDVKQIFIQPVFVNADEGWIENQRKEYRVKL